MYFNFFITCKQCRHLFHSRELCADVEPKYFQMKEVIFDDRNKFDVKIKHTSGKSIDCHWEALKTNSSYFGMMDYKGPGFEIELDFDFDFDILVDICRSLYGEKLELTVKNVYTVFKFAEKYKIDRISDWALTYLETCFNNLDLSKLTAAKFEILARLCREMIYGENNIYDELATFSHKSFQKHLLKSMTKSSTVSDNFGNFYKDIRESTLVSFLTNAKLRVARRDHLLDGVVHWIDANKITHPSDIATYLYYVLQVKIGVNTCDEWVEEKYDFSDTDASEVGYNERGLQDDVEELKACVERQNLAPTHPVVAFINSWTDKPPSFPRKLLTVTTRASELTFDWERMKDRPHAIPHCSSYYYREVQRKQYLLSLSDNHAVDRYSFLKQLPPKCYDIVQAAGLEFLAIADRPNVYFEVRRAESTDIITKLDCHLVMEVAWPVGEGKFEDKVLTVKYDRIRRLVHCHGDPKNPEDDYYYETVRENADEPKLTEKHFQSESILNNIIYLLY